MPPHMRQHYEYQLKIAEEAVERFTYAFNMAYDRWQRAVHERPVLDGTAIPEWAFLKEREKEMLFWGERFSNLLDILKGDKDWRSPG